MRLEVIGWPLNRREIAYLCAMQWQTPAGAFLVRICKTNGEAEGVPFEIAVDRARELLDREGYFANFDSVTMVFEGEAVLKIVRYVFNYTHGDNIDKSCMNESDLVLKGKMVFSNGKTYGVMLDLKNHYKIDVGIYGDKTTVSFMDEGSDHVALTLIQEGYAREFIAVLKDESDETKEEE